MLPDQNSNSYSTQGWLAQIYELLEGGICGGNMQNGIIINQNSVIINGTAFFVTNTKPTTRIDGSALVAGDRWYNTNEGTEWFWNGSYWLGQLQTSTASAINNSFTVGLYFPSSTFGNRQVFIQRLIRGYWVATADASNYWTSTGLAYRFFGDNGATGVLYGGNDIFSSTINTLTTGTWVETEETVEVMYTPGPIPESLSFGFNQVGAPSNISFYGVLYFRQVYP